MTEMTSGYHPGDLVIVAGRPGMGKSVVGMQQAQATAKADVVTLQTIRQWTMINITNWGNLPAIRRGRATRGRTHVAPFQI